MKAVKYMIVIVLGFVILLSFDDEKKLPSRTEFDVITTDNEVNLIIATDIHYLSPALVERGDIFDDLYKNGDGKQMNYIAEITDAFIKDVIKQQPDGLILSGDLTFNGEKKSHQELAMKLNKVEKSGIPVMVIPGNHDINNFYASGFAKDSTYPVDRIGAEGFRELYGTFGFQRALYKDPYSLSYVTAITEDIWLFMIDSNRYKNNNIRYKSDATGVISKKSLDWLKSCLKEAKANGVTPITVMHHNLLTHNELFQDGFTIDNSEDVQEILKEHNVKVNLSGHIHAQHIEHDSTNAIYDIVTSALSVYPIQYGMIHISPKKDFTYKTKSVDVETWAKENNVTNPDLLDFKRYSYRFFHDHSYNQTIGWLKNHGFNEREMDSMAKVTGEFNTAFFSGKINLKRDKIIESKGYQHWERMDDSFMKLYMDSVLLNRAKDENYLQVSLQ